MASPADHSPLLVVIAGPNGAGKTEFTRAALRHEWLKDCLYVNPDEIANDRFGGWNDSDAVLAAAQYAESLRRKCLKEGRSLAFETVFSTKEKVRFVEDAKAAGFFIRLFYIATDSPQINAARVAKRVEQGGHDVPIPKIIDRHYRSLARLAEVLPIVDRGYVYDNSKENANAQLQFRLADGRIKTYSEGHAWANMVRESAAKALARSQPVRASGYRAR